MWASKPPQYVTSDPLIMNNSNHVISYVRHKNVEQSATRTDVTTNTVRQTDGQTDDMQSQDHTLHYNASRGKND